MRRSHQEVWMLRPVLVCAAVLALVLSWSGPVVAQKTVHVKPYTRKDGTQVRGYDRRAPSRRGSSGVSGSDSSAAGEGPVLPSTPPTGEGSKLTALTDDEVLDKLGSPSLTDPTTWHFDSRRGTLRLTFR